MKILLAFIAATLVYAQPTILPSTVTLTPGTPQQFTTSAKTPYWIISGNGAIDAKSGKYTAPAAVPPTGATVRVYDLSTGLHADAVVTLVASLPVQSTACPCSGDIFVLSSSPAATATFTRTTDGTWTAPASITVPFLALMQVYRNGARVQEKDIASLSYSDGKMVLVTNGPWSATDAVTAKWVMVNK